MRTAVQEQDTMRRERKERVVVKVTVAEKAKFHQLAEKLHTDLSELARQLLHGKADEVFRNQAA